MIDFKSKTETNEMVILSFEIDFEMFYYFYENLYRNFILFTKIDTETSLVYHSYLFAWKQLKMNVIENVMKC